jgi:hypothetical protein
MAEAISHMNVCTVACWNAYPAFQLLLKKNHSGKKVLRKLLKSQLSQEKCTPGSWDTTSETLWRTSGKKSHAQITLGEVVFVTHLWEGQQGTRTSDLFEEKSILLVLENNCTKPPKCHFLPSLPHTLPSKQACVHQRSFQSSICLCVTSVNHLRAKA